MRPIKISDFTNSLVRTLFSAAAIVSCCHLASAREAAGELEEPALLKSVDGKLIEMQYFSVPTVADIDGDGKSDLVIGQFMNSQRPGGGSAGTATWYRNESKGDELPTYAPGVDLKSNSGLIYADNW